MAINDKDLKALDMENPELDREQQAIKEAAQTDTVVRGVNGAAEPKARRLRPLAGIIIIAVVVLAALYMRNGMANPPQEIDCADRDIEDWSRSCDECREGFALRSGEEWSRYRANTCSRIVDATSLHSGREWIKYRRDFKRRTH